jgi:hypothetical protein
MNLILVMLKILLASVPGLIEAITKALGIIHPLG